MRTPEEITQDGGTDKEWADSTRVHFGAAHCGACGLECTKPGEPTKPNQCPCTGCIRHECHWCPNNGGDGPQAKREPKYVHIEGQMEIPV